MPDGYQQYQADPGRNEPPAGSALPFGGLVVGAVALMIPAFLLNLAMGFYNARYAVCLWRGELEECGTAVVLNLLYFLFSAAIYVVLLLQLDWMRSSGSKGEAYNQPLSGRDLRFMCQFFIAGSLIFINMPVLVSDAVAVSRFYPLYALVSVALGLAWPILLGELYFFLAQSATAKPNLRLWRLNLVLAAALQLVWVLCNPMHLLNEVTIYPEAEMVFSKALMLGVVLLLLALLLLKSNRRSAPSFGPESVVLT